MENVKKTRKGKERRECRQVEAAGGSALAVILGQNPGDSALAGSAAFLPQQREERKSKGKKKRENDNNNNKRIIIK